MEKDLGNFSDDVLKFFKRKTTGGKVSIIGYNGIAIDIVIPSEIKGKPVTSIGQNAFSNRISLQSITIPDTVTSIGYKAFSCCTKLKSITIPDSVTSIGENAFYGCSSLQSITIPDSVTSIGVNAFRNCSSLSNIAIPDSVTSIGDCAFYDTAYYENESNWDNDVLYVGNYLIVAKRNISGDYIIKNGTKMILDSAFYWCSSLESITIPDSVTSIGYSAFEGCSSLQSITIPNTVTSIDLYAFEGCSSLQSITIPDSIKSIGFNAFYETGYYYNEENWEDGVLYIGNHLICANEDIDYDYEVKNGTKTIADGAFIFEDCGLDIESITIPDSVTNIGCIAFSGCESLERITIPNSIIDFDERAFEDCSSLEEVHISSIENWLNMSFYSDSNPLCNGAKLYLNNKLVESITIPNGVTEIKDFVFNGCSSLKSIVIPDSVTSIGEDAFSDCSSLEIVNYTGTQEQWDKINIDDSNEPLTSATINFKQ